MFIAILQGGEVENELDIVMHCADCVARSYGWSNQQYKTILSAIKANKVIQVPIEVDSIDKFVEHVKSIKV